MFKMLSELTKAAVGVVVSTPVAIVSDVVTMGGACNDRPEPYTATAIREVVGHVQKATK